MDFRATTVLFILAFVAASGCVKDSGEDEPRLDYALDCTVAELAPTYWPEPCLALASPNPSTAKAEVDLAVNPTDPLNIVVASKDKDPEASNDCVWSVAQVTKDGGRTWTTVYVGGGREDRAPEATGYECVTDPMMAFDTDGTFYYAMQIYDHTPRGNVGVPCPVPLPVSCTVPDTGSAFILARSQDGGLTFDRYVLQAPGAGDLLFHDYPRMIVNPATGAVHTIWNAYLTVATEGTVRPVVSTSRDGGETVDPPLVLFDADPQSPLAFFSGFAATRDGTLFVTMQKAENSDAGEPTTAWIWRSDDDGRTFQEVGAAFEIQPTERQHGNHSFRTPSFVEMAIDATDGPFADRIYLFWTDDRTGDSDVLSSVSDDGGLTWSEAKAVCLDCSGGQYFMRPRVGPDGTVFVLYATQAYSGTEWLDQELAWSKDGGATWQNLRLTEASYDGDLGIHQDDFPFIGDYNGLDVDPEGGVHAAFGHTGTGRAEIAYAHVVPT